MECTRANLAVTVDVERGTGEGLPSYEDAGVHQLVEKRGQHQPVKTARSLFRRPLEAITSTFNHYTPFGELRHAATLPTESINPVFMRVLDRLKAEWTMSIGVVS
jgi:hypothetical protein